MTERGINTLAITFIAENSAPILELASIFGEIDPPKVSLKVIQCATPELKGKVTDFVDRYQKNAPHLFRLRKLVTDMPDGEFFLLLQTSPTSSAEEFRYGDILRRLNHPEISNTLDEHNQLFGQLLELYDIFTPRTDKRLDIGNSRKTDRICRFCGGTTKTKARFDKEAHAIPAALGNKHLKLADECDTCNQYFGEEIEPTLVELLNIQRVFLGIEARSGSPTVKFPGGSMFRNQEDDKMMVIVPEKISQEASGALTAQLGRGKPIIPQNFYRALSKIALSVVPEEELPALAKTARWVRYGQAGDKPLPNIATAMVMLPPEPSAQITLYLRKAPHPTLPHVICEFRLGCYMYVFALPFSENDESDLIGFFEAEDFKQTFRHYGFVPSWRQQDYSASKEIQVIQSITIQPRKTSNDKPVA